MEYRTNRVNSAGTGGIEPKNFERDGPKFSSARTEISENPQIFTQQISKKIYFLLNKKNRAQNFPYMPCTHCMEYPAPGTYARR